MKRFLPSLILTVPFFIGCPGGESSDDSAAALLLLGAGETTQATCSLVSAHGTTVMPLFTLTGDRSVTAQVQDNAHAHWMAFSIPNVQDGTEVDFSFDPKYTPGGPAMLFVYYTSACPIDDDGAGSDTDGETAMGGASTANFTWDNTQFKLTVTAAGAGKGDMIIIAAPTANPSGGTVTRNDP